MTDYIKSNSLETIKGLKKLPSSLKDAIIEDTSMTGYSRAVKGQKVVNAICSKLGIPAIKLYVKDTPQKHTDRNGKLRRKVLGMYWHRGSVGKDIVIWNLTAKRLKVVSSKTFWNTLLHEVCHHIDCAFLGITSSPHTAGFYKRISYIDSCFG